ncbi:MAG TPA: hypothetical protein VFQ47_09575, partial [Nitrososphaera sp.]|nr:hypothetical protein [Nitrososphaera sp.]
MRKLISIWIVILICWPGLASPQARLYSEREGKLIKEFFEENGKCKDLLKKRKWKEAEMVCKGAIKIADQLPADRLLEKMG